MTGAEIKSWPANRLNHAGAPPMDNFYSSKRNVITPGPAQSPSLAQTVSGRAWM